MSRPNEEQVQTAGAIIMHHNKTYGMSGNENSLRRLVFSIFATLGGGGAVADEYSQVIASSDLKLKMASAETKETVAPETSTAPDWFTITVDQVTGEVVLEVTGENEYGFEQGMTLDNFDTLRMFDDDDDDDPDADEAGTGDKRWPITPEQLDNMNFADLKKVADDESADIAGKNSKVDVRTAILDNRAKIDAELNDKASGD